MCWVRSKSSRTGSVNYKPNMVRPCRIRTVTISLKITDIGRYRCIAIYIAQFCYDDWMTKNIRLSNNTLTLFVLTVIVLTVVVVTVVVMTVVLLSSFAV